MKEREQEEGDRAHKRMEMVKTSSGLRQKSKPMEREKNESGWSHTTT